MIISYRHKMMYFHNPKTAGVATRAFIKEHHRCADIENLERGRLGEYWEAYPHLFFAYRRHTTIENYFDYLSDDFGKEIWNDYWKFAFVRNPWDRVLSMYSWLSQKAIEFGVSDTFTDSDSFHTEYPTVNEWIAELYESHKWKVDDLNIRPQHKWTHHRGKLVINFVGRFENFKDDFRVVAKKMGLPEDAFPEYRNTTKHDDYRSYYTDESAAQVAEIFAGDIELFGYEFG